MSSIATPDPASIRIMRDVLTHLRVFCETARTQTDLPAGAAAIEGLAAQLSAGEQYEFYTGLTSLCFNVDTAEIDANITLMAEGDEARKLFHAIEGTLETIGQTCAEEPKKATHLIAVIDHALIRLDDLENGGAGAPALHFS